MRVILNLMNENNPWASVSSEINQIDIFQRIRNAELTSAVGADGRLQVGLSFTPWVLFIRLIIAMWLLLSPMKRYFACSGCSAAVEHTPAKQNP